MNCLCKLDSEKCSIHAKITAVILGYIERVYTMEKKYNLALMPILKSNEFIEVAQKFSGVSDKYLLGKNSFPHVTLYQFEAEEKEIDGIWQKVTDVWRQKPIDLELGEFSYITFDMISIGYHYYQRIVMYYIKCMH